MIHVDVRGLKKKRFSLPINPKERDPWIEELDFSKEKDIILLVPEGWVENASSHNRERIEYIRSSYHIKALVEVFNPFSNRSSYKFTLAIFSKNKVDKVLVIALNRHKTYRECESARLIVWYEKYLDVVQEALNTNNKKDEFISDVYELKYVSSTLVKQKGYVAKRYTEKVLKAEALLKKEPLAFLGNVADIIRKIGGTENICGVVGHKAQTYPLSYDKLETRVALNISLQENDILWSPIGGVYLIDHKPKQLIYANINYTIIRPRNICPEYLMMYLSSETLQTIRWARGAGVQGILLGNGLEQLPVILPKESDDFYKKLFKLEYCKIKDITDFSNINFYRNNVVVSDGNSNDVIQSLGEQAVTLSDILTQEFMDAFTIHKREILQEFLENDFYELNSCFSVKAYKATLILAGSILEAVLIDWLSEIHKKNYFEENYRVVDRQSGRYKNANLVDYIDAIKEIERPHWMSEAEKAHNIRQKRNLVHARLCLNSDEINENSCRMVVAYLADIIKTRNELR